MIFDGRAFAREIEERLREQVAEREQKPKIVSVLVGNDPSSELYTRLKKSAAERVGIGFEVVRPVLSNLKKEIGELGRREDVTGIMIQLPIPGLSEGETEKILQEIPLHKDVDGLLWEQSGVKPATVRAALTILERIRGDVSELWQRKFVVVGARGAVGRPLVTYLHERGVRVEEIGRNTKEPEKILLGSEVVISCVGKAGLVTEDMVQEGVIVIDVGMSEVGNKVVGDMTNKVYQKASVAVAVPGGVGPVTVVSLLQNAVDLGV